MKACPLIFPRVSNAVRREALKIKCALTGAIPKSGRKKVLLLNYTGLEENHGCIATSAALIGLIERAWPGAALRIKPVTFTPPKYPLNAAPLDFERQAQAFLISEKRWFAYFDWADVIVFNGEGSMHEYENAGQNRCFLARLTQLYAAKKIFNKRVFSVNQTVEFGEGLSGVVLKCFEGLDLVSVREPESFEKLKGLGVGNLRLSADAAFLTRPSQDGRAELLLKRKGISGRLAFMFLSETIRGCSPDKTSDLVKSLSERLGKQVILVATTAADKAHARKVQMKTGVRTMGLEAGPGELVSLLGKADLVLSGRYHCCIFAFLAGVPFIPFSSNSYKITGLMKMMGYPVRVHDYAVDPTSSIIQAAEGVLSRAHELRRLFSKMRPRLLSMAEAALHPADGKTCTQEHRPW